MIMRRRRRGRERARITHTKDKGFKIFSWQSHSLLSLDFDDVRQHMHMYNALVLCILKYIMNVFMILINGQDHQVSK